MSGRIHELLVSIRIPSLEARRFLLESPLDLLDDVKDFAKSDKCFKFLFFFLVSIFYEITAFSRIIKFFISYFLDKMTTTITRFSIS